MHMDDHELHSVCGSMAKRAGAMDVVDRNFIIQHTANGLSAHGADQKQYRKTGSGLAWQRAFCRYCDTLCSPKSKAMPLCLKSKK